MKDSKELSVQLKKQFFFRNKLIFTVSLITSMLLAFGGIGVSWILKQLIDAASGISGAFRFSTIIILIFAYVVIFMSLSVLDMYTRPLFIKRAMQQYKDFVFRKLTEKGIGSFRAESTAAYLSAISNDATSIETNYISQLFELFSKTVMFIGSFVLMLMYSPVLTAIAIAVTIIPLAVSILSGKRLSGAEKAVSDQNALFTADLKDCLGGFSVIKSFQAEKEVYKMFSSLNLDLENTKYKRECIRTRVGMIGMMAALLAQMGVFVAGTYMILSGDDLTTGTVMMFVNLMNFMIQPVAVIPKILAGRKASEELIMKLSSMLLNNTENTGSEEIDSIREGIVLENVSFGYEDGKEILHDISAEFAAGKSYAIVGASGSGKSTLLNLLADPGADYSGQIRMDDKERRDVTAEGLFKTVSTIQQNVFVFNATIRDNITMFRDFPKEEVDRAIQCAHLTALMDERGGNTMCGENGCSLSGGEKQRISIARSLLKKSSVLMADEATAALDAQTAWQVSDDILGLSGITRIVVTHSLEESLLKRYDGIVVLKDGRIEEKGTFSELMEKKGYFHALFTISQ
ncbi:MAG: ABC transporter ATP-binding protein [Lachnospiraceae bacterium]|nr:ABC transporter ATP-binding protein [Lachnospiraceae bacterium]